MERRKKRTFYWMKNKEFKTYGKMKEYAFFHMYKGESERADMIDEDGEIKKIYLIERTDRRVIIKTVKDYKKEQIENENKKQLKLW
jgi:hypothetical protein